jgi:hypothetical protein
VIYAGAALLTAVAAYAILASNRDAIDDMICSVRDKIASPLPWGRTRTTDPGKLYDDCRNKPWAEAVSCCNKLTDTQGTGGLDDPEFRSCMSVAGW